MGEVIGIMGLVQSECSYQNQSFRKDNTLSGESLFRILVLRTSLNFIVNVCLGTQCDSVMQWHL